MVDLDLKDKKILALLSINSRLKLHEIAKQVNLSKNSIKYRIERLLKLSYIRKFIPIIDYEKINYTTFDLFIKLRIRKEDEGDLINYFKAHSNVIWLTTLFGEWDVFVQFVAKDFDELYFVYLKDFFEKFGSHISYYEVKVAVQVFKLGANLAEFSKLIKNVDTIRGKKKEISGGNFILDPLDTKILNALSQNARASFQKLGQMVGESLETVRNRFNKLVNAGVLLGFTAYLADAKLGYYNYIVILESYYMLPETEKKFSAFLNEREEILFALKNGHAPESYLLLATKTPYEAESLLKELRDRYFNEIRKMVSTMITEDVRVDMFPIGLVQN